MNLEKFKSLPIEILEDIFSYLNTADIIILSKICLEFENVSHSRKLVRKVNLFNEYKINFIDTGHFVCSKPRCNFITILNISCIYWVPAAEIRKCLNKMISLERLYAVDTELGLLKADFIAYKHLPKLKRLAVSASKHSFCKEAVSLFPNITHFYLLADTFFIDNSLECLFEKIESLCLVEEFWCIESLTGYPNNNNIHSFFPCFPAHIKRFTVVLNSCRVLNPRQSDLRNWYEYYKSVTNGLKISAEINKKDLIYEVLENDNDNNWRCLLQFLRGDSPFSVKQSHELFFKKRTLKSINFEEINFIKIHLPCHMQVIETVLLYENMKLLKKLSLFINHACMEQDVLCQPKRQKIDNNDIKSSCLLQKVSGNLQFLEELELFGYESIINSEFIKNDSLCTIGNFKYLKKLSLWNIPYHINGSFLNNVLSSCRQLKTLRIKTYKQNSSLHNHLCIALKSTNSLKHIRYEHLGNISIDKFFEALLMNKYLKLERLFIKCRSVDVFSVKPFQNFIEVNPDLKFLYLVIQNLPLSVIKKVMEHLQSYMSSDRQKIFVITRDEFNYKGRVKIPQITKFEMLQNRSNVSTVDVFNGFTI